MKPLDWKREHDGGLTATTTDPVNGHELLVTMQPVESTDLLVKLRVSIFDQDQQKLEEPLFRVTTENETLGATAVAGWLALREGERARSRS